MALVTQNFYYFDRETAEALVGIKETLSSIKEMLEMSFDDLKAAQDAIDAKVDAVAADIQVLMDKLAAISVPGMTPEQEAALADATAHAQATLAKLTALDDKNP